MRDAVARFVPDGASVLLGAGLECLIPFSAGHEIIRQGKRDLTLLGPISDMLFDQMIGAGCVREVKAAWVGNVSAGLGHCFRRAVEKGVPRPIQVTDYSNFTFALALQAAAQGVPFLPTRTALGSDLPLSNSDLVAMTSPFGGDPLIAVRALQPDVSFIAAQRADDTGGAHCWGPLGVAVEACLASRDVVLVVEDIVPHEMITSDPNRVLAPPFRISAVVHEPFGSHPSPVQGYYGRDHRAYHEYHDESRSGAGADGWLNSWVRTVSGRTDYVRRLDPQRMQDLKVEHERLAASVNYGF